MPCEKLVTERNTLNCWLCFPFVVRQMWGYRESLGLSDNPNQIYAFPTTQERGLPANVYSSLNIGFMGVIGNRTEVGLQMEQDLANDFSIMLVMDVVDCTFKLGAEELNSRDVRPYYYDFYAYPDGGYYGRVNLRE